jgi:hypothetical protein
VLTDVGWDCFEGVLAHPSCARQRSAFFPRTRCAASGSPEEEGRRVLRIHAGANGNIRMYLAASRDPRARPPRHCDRPCLHPTWALGPAGVRARSASMCPSHCRRLPGRRVGRSRSARYRSIPVTGPAGPTPSARLPVPVGSGISRRYMPRRLGSPISRLPHSSR